MENAMLCDIIVIFLYGFSFFGCIFEFFKISAMELVPTFFNVMPVLSDSIFLCTGAFCLFVLLYSNHCGAVKQLIYSTLLLMMTFFVRMFTLNPEEISEDYISLVPIIIIFVPILLLIIFSNINHKGK